MILSAPPSPDSKKKKPALPSLLSSLRNARQAVVGRASDAAEDLLYERELRPLTGGGGGSGSSNSLVQLGSTSASGGNTGSSANRPQHLQRGGGGGGGVGGGGVGGIGAPSTSMSSNATFTATLQNFSQRFGNKFRGGGRARNRRKKGSGVTVVPQEFYLAVGCFFFVFPIFFMIYIYFAGHSVFGGNDGHQVQKIDLEDAGSVLNQTALDAQFDVEDLDNSQGMLIEDEMGNLRDSDRIVDQSTPPLDVDNIGHHDKKKFPFTKRSIDGSLTEDITMELTGNDDGNISAMKAMRSGNSKGTSNMHNSELVSVRERGEEDKDTRSSFDQNNERRRA
ncbi:hypothetical protein ACHAWU_008454 [Discostella pseudostelligera]|uniref:Uncharacterized protein n=1 Tax=Discostella pseudostelligera TaxID=259834 RepID=A0ABD3LZW7_9STRA